MKILNKHLEVKRFLKTNNITETASLSDTSIGFVHKVKGLTIKSTKIDKAVIWAAGWGSRLMPVTTKIPKPLVVVDDEPMIETGIKMLKRAGIEDITLVLGREFRKFDELVKKYNLKVVMNTKWQKHNNVSSYFAAMSEFDKGCFLMDADLVINEDFTPDTRVVNSYMVTGVTKDSRDIVISKNGSWVSTYKNGAKTHEKLDGEQYKGIFCLKKEDLKKLSEDISKEYDIQSEYNDNYWFDHLFKLTKKGDIKMESKVIPFNQITEVDTIEDLIKKDPKGYPSRDFIEEKYGKK